MKKKAILLIMISFALGIFLNLNLFMKDSNEIQVAELEAYAYPVPDYFMNETPNMCWTCSPDAGWCDVSAQCCAFQWPFCE